MGALTDRHPFLDHPGPIPFAHRGGAALEPENTLAAFAAAVALGFRYLETDVRVTSDGVLVAFHDDRLGRTTGLAGRVAETRATDLPPEVPRLEAVLEAFPDARINLDPKHDAAVPPLLRILAAPGVLERTCVGSFSSARVEAVRGAFGRRACTAMTPRELLRLRAAAWGARGLLAALRDGPADCLQVPTRASGIPLVDARMLAAAHDLARPVHVWTVDDPDEMERLLDLGVDGLMSDRPDVLREVLRRRGAWRGDAVVASPA